MNEWNEKKKKGISTTFKGFSSLMNSKIRCNRIALQGFVGQFVTMKRSVMEEFFIKTFAPV